MTERLTSESERLLDAAAASEKERRGEKPKGPSTSLHRKAVRTRCTAWKASRTAGPAAADVDEAAADPQCGACAERFRSPLQRVLLC
ncbi:hypothetical protein SBD_0947 [Streptomyces bottropensis ATCC 25435]|uniref:Uncharacterized protein n=1 Tax=Streptomyces bottropensis ATCC 25435 TaxID=1054862 RepID=M3FYV6_9ACTN|nr:hypothetical protein SBD_0947 [Streptomyces bottropensis ATCC 25435]